MAKVKDKELGKLLVKKGLVSSIKMKECIQVQKDLYEQGEKKSLEAILLENKWVTSQDIITIKNYLLLGEEVDLPNIQLLKKLGEGAMGVVFKGVQISLERPVAIKILDPDLGKEQAFVDRFHQEARMLASLSHQNIVKGIDFGVSGNVYYFVMEYLKAKTLGEIVAVNGPLEYKMSFKILQQMAQALEYAHKKGLVHRDIKPDNILLCSNKKAKLCDLGLAKWRKRNLELTSAGTVIGTPYYLSPEQAQGEIDVDIRSDIYSLGATFYFLLTGEPPYDGDRESVIHYRHIYDPPPKVTEINPQLPSKLDILFEKMMHKDKTKRIQTPTELINHLQKMNSSARKSDIVRKDPPAAVVAAEPKVVRKATTRKVPPRTTKRYKKEENDSREFLIAFLIVLIVFLLVAIIYVTSQRF